MEWGQSKLLWISYMSSIVLAILPSLVPIENLMRPYPMVIRAKDKEGSTVMVVKWLSTVSNAERRPNSMKIGSLYLVRRKLLVTRKLLSVWDCFLQCLSPGCSQVWGSQGFKKKQQEGVAIDVSWVGEIDTSLMFFLNVAQERFPWDHMVDRLW